MYTIKIVAKALCVYRHLATKLGSFFICCVKTLFEIFGHSKSSKEVQRKFFQFIFENFVALKVFVKNIAVGVAAVAVAVVALVVAVAAVVAAVALVVVVVVVVVVVFVFVVVVAASVAGVYAAVVVAVVDPVVVDAFVVVAVAQMQLLLYLLQLLRNMSLPKLHLLWSLSQLLSVIFLMLQRRVCCNFFMSCL